SRRWHRRRYEHVRAIHSQAGGDHAADRGDRISGNGGVPPAPCFTSAAGGLPDDFGERVAAGREPGDHGIVGGCAARASTRAYRRRNGNYFGQLFRDDLDYAAV